MTKRTREGAFEPIGKIVSRLVARLIETETATPSPEAPPREGTGVDQHPAIPVPSLPNELIDTEASAGRRVPGVVLGVK